MAKTIKDLSGAVNTDILNAIRNEASLAYQQRIPVATKSGLQQILNTLTEYRPYWNEFSNALINRIGSVIVRSHSWSNPLGIFKRGLLDYGQTIEEIAVGMLEAHSYSASAEYMEKDLFGIEQPNVQANFHSINREDFYKITINDLALRRAFTSEDAGLSQFIAELMAAPEKSDQWDEFLLMCRLFSEYERRWGFFKVQTADITGGAGITKNDTDNALIQMRTKAEEIQFISNVYNAAGWPSAANRDDLVLFATPEYKARVDVQSLAAAFNVERAEYQEPIVIPKQHLGIKGAQALLTTKDFFVVGDVALENTVMENPVGLSRNMFLHHHQIISASRFVPAILFTTEASTVIDVAGEITGSITGVKLWNSDEVEVQTSAVPRGAMYVIEPQATVSPTTATVGFTYIIEGANSLKTRFDVKNSVLRIGSDETASEITVVCTAHYSVPASTRVTLTLT